MITDPAQTTWVGREEWARLRTLQVHAQIRLRRHMMRQMVGSLYPSILADEITELQKLICVHAPIE